MTRHQNRHMPGILLKKFQQRDIMSTCVTRCDKHLKEPARSTKRMPDYLLVNWGLKTALTQLWRAYEYSEMTSSSVWEFAVELGELKETAVSIDILRRLIQQGYVEHGCEVTEPAKGRRKFCRDQNLMFTEYSCFILTSSGASLARSLSGGRTGRGFESHTNRARIRPKWNRNRKELWFGNTLIKRFRSKAKNQTIILAAFEEQGWPLRIDDPLPPNLGVAPTRRLQDTIKGLNRRQLRTLVRFRGDGTGQGIRWQRA